VRPSFARLTITRLRFPTRDDRGVLVPDYDAEPDRLDIRRCWLEPTTSTEQNDGRLAVATGYTVDAPYQCDVLASDLVEYEGIRYEVTGDPQHVPSPTGALNATRLTLQRWEG
jgi:hypothetical protein